MSNVNLFLSKMYSLLELGDIFFLQINISKAVKPQLLTKEIQSGIVYQHCCFYSYSGRFPTTQNSSLGNCWPWHLNFPPSFLPMSPPNAATEAPYIELQQQCMVTFQDPVIGFVGLLKDKRVTCNHLLWHSCKCQPESLFKTWAFHCILGDRWWQKGPYGCFQMAIARTKWGLQRREA